MTSTFSAKQIDLILAPGGDRQHRESEPHSGLTTRIPAKLRTQIKIYCLEHDLDMRDFITEALKEKLAKGGPTNDN